ncbi:hypothetical protein ACFQ7N_36905 [Streptomyces niveus]|uniref:hypothetical protein n=1 Tax=Streptomyces niveus TaxID=193462 RepID=UPI0036A04AD0
MAADPACFTPLAPHTYISGLRVVVAGGDRSPHPVTTGQVDADAVHAYLYGQCHALAQAISEATGWEMAALATVDCCCVVPYVAPCRAAPVGANVRACQPEHVMAVRPSDGAFVDITGARPADCVPPGYRAVPMTAALAAHIATNWAWAAPNVEVARTFVEPLLNSLSAPGSTVRAPDVGVWARPATEEG